MADIPLPDVPAVERAIVEQTNKFRKENALAPVAPNATLTKAARAYADYLAKTGAFSHEADGTQPADRAEKAGYKYCQVAENLARHLDSRGFPGSTLAGLAVEGWKESPGHRKNLLLPHVNEIGVAVVRITDKHPKYVSVQLFGRPLAARQEITIKNLAAKPVTYEFGGETHEVGTMTVAVHTACEPSAMTLRTFGSGGAQKKIEARYETRDGLVFTLKPDKVKGVVVELSDKKQASAR